VDSGKPLAGWGGMNVSSSIPIPPRSYHRSKLRPRLSVEAHAEARTSEVATEQLSSAQIYLLVLDGTEA